MIYHPIESEMEMFARVYSRDTGVRIIFGQGFSTDGKIITIVRLLDHADPWVRFEIEMGVYHETGHVISKDFSTFNSYKDKTKKVLFNVVRDVTIEGKIMEIRYPGMKSKWATFLSWVVDRNNQTIASRGVKPFQMLMWALYFRAREYQHGENFGPGIILPPAIEEIYDRRILPFIPETAEHEGIPASQDLVEKIYEELMKEPPPPPQPKQQAQSGDGEGEPRQSEEESEEGGGGLDGTPDEWEEKEKEKEKKKTAPSKSTEDEEEAPENEEEDSEDTSKEDSSKDEDESKEGSEGSEDSENENKENSEDEDESDKNSKGSEDSENKNEDESEDENEGNKSDENSKDENKSEEEEEDDKNDEDNPEDSPDSEGDENGKDEDSENPFSDDGEEALKKAQEEMENGAEGTSVGEEIAEDVNKYANTTHLYREVAGLKEKIIQSYPRHAWAKEVASYEDQGKKMTGYAGTKLKILFISEQAPVTHRNLKNGKLDCLNLWKTKTGSTDVCKRKIPSSLEDSAVSMVVDNSSSMNGAKGIITHSLMTALSTDLDKLRIPFEAIGFTTEWMGNGTTAKVLANTGVRSHPITIHLMKTFAESYRLVRHRFVWPANTNGTAELPAIVFAAKRLVERRETKKVMFILTDGGTCTGNDNLNASMHEATKDFIERMKRAGIKVVLIGIQSNCVLDYDPNAIVLTDLNIFASQFYSNLMKLLL